MHAQNWPQRRTMICLESGLMSILHPLCWSKWLEVERATKVARQTSVGILEVPNNLENWVISRGVPRTISGWSSPVHRSWMKPNEDIIKDAARGSWAPRSGVGSFLRSSVSPSVIMDVKGLTRARRTDWGQGPPDLNETSTIHTRTLLYSFHCTVRLTNWNRS